MLFIPIGSETKVMQSIIGVNIQNGEISEQKSRTLCSLEYKCYNWRSTKTDERKNEKTKMKIKEMAN